MRRNLTIEGLPAGQHTIEDYTLDYRPDDNSVAIQIKVNGRWYTIAVDDKQEFLIIATVLQSGRTFVTDAGFIRGSR